MDEHCCQFLARVSQPPPAVKAHTVNLLSYIVGVGKHPDNASGETAALPALSNTNSVTVAGGKDRSPKHRKGISALNGVEGNIVGGKRQNTLVEGNAQ